MREKLELKDLINIGIFGAVYIIAMMAVVTVLGMVPILYVVAPIFVAMVCGTIYMLFIMRTPKTGAVMIMSVLMAFIFMGAAWYASVWVLLVGAVVEAMLLNGGHKSLGKVKMSYLIYGCTTVGPYWGFVLFKSSFIESAAGYYGQAYADGLNRVTPAWGIIPLLVATVIGAWVGVTIGEKILKKHFKRAGIVE